MVLTPWLAMCRSTFGLAMDASLLLEGRGLDDYRRLRHVGGEGAARTGGDGLDLVHGVHAAPHLAERGVPGLAGRIDQARVVGVVDEDLRRGGGRGVRARQRDRAFGVAGAAVRLDGRAF